jgi:hypothetical protein
MGMGNVPKIHTHFSLPIELRFRAIPTRWRQSINPASGERDLVPAVNQHVERKLACVEEPEEIRKQFFRMDIDEESAIKFLNGVGVWSFVEDLHVNVKPDGSLLSGNLPVGFREMEVKGAFGHRWLMGRALIQTVEMLQAEQAHWRELLRNRKKLRAEFGPAPPSSSAPYIKEGFALESQFGNTITVHLEWRGKRSYAVIQPVTGRELLMALAWIDLVTGAVVKVCGNPNCKTEYTHGGTKFCSLRCERANTKRASRHRTKRADAIIRANPHLSIRKLLDILAKEEIKRDRAWVVKAKARIQLEAGTGALETTRKSLR